VWKILSEIKSIDSDHEICDNQESDRKSGISDSEKIDSQLVAGVSM
jgi:hypothetical protein